MNDMTTESTIQQFDDIAHEIVHQINLGRQAAISIGELLLDARELLPSNNEFGDWCSDNLSGRMNQKAIHRAMQLAKHFSGKTIGTIPLSGLYELSAPKYDEVRDDVVAELLPRESVTVKDVKERLAVAAPTKEPAPKEPTTPEPTTDDPDITDVMDMEALQLKNLYLLATLGNYVKLHDLGCLLLKLRKSGTDEGQKFRTDNSVIKHVRANMRKLGKTMGEAKAFDFTDEHARDALAVARNDEQGEEIRSEMLNLLSNEWKEAAL